MYIVGDLMAPPPFLLPQNMQMAFDGCRLDFFHSFGIIVGKKISYKR
jgi:hypothetical protein